jgi:hypothetical protein
VSVGGLSNEPANNPKSFPVNPPKSRNSFSFAGPFAGYCKAFYDKCVDQPANDLQTTGKRKFRFAKCGNFGLYLHFAKIVIIGGTAQRASPDGVPYV